MNLYELQDRDECLELPNICGERVKCLNTPGEFNNAYFLHNQHSLQLTVKKTIAFLRF